MNTITLCDIHEKYLLKTMEVISVSIIDNIKSVASVIQKADNIELYRKILDLQYEAMELVQQNNELRNQIMELRGKLSTQENLVFRNNQYWKVLEGDKQDGPYCSKCWDVDNKLVRHNVLNNGYVTCPNCQMTVDDENYRGQRQNEEDSYRDWINY
ncbi:hypothetical protein [Cohnella thailandensis]|uniref:Uncharacterized protein n=1 Tax=Cohnella thailandensis TaxID=557557 RepID=A0A841SPA1_9BACL|nr:hypothetical protein [Cohnella thailandensis]MBB6632619.1 hypothetical protein [Cohnella thailandensis]MBP1975695.1 uncharacterized Zn finger protein (UPF0148 family) [Cohnella thailandensis]